MLDNELRYGLLRRLTGPPLDPFLRIEKHCLAQQGYSKRGCFDGR